VTSNQSSPQYQTIEAFNESLIEKSYEIEKLLGVTPLTAKLIINRVENIDNLEKFISCKLSDIELPDKLPDYFKTLDRITKAISEKEKIGLFGDYDVDGIGSVSIISLFFRELDVNHKVVIAHRKYGYGLTCKNIEEFNDIGIKLLIACDVGSTDYDAAQKCKEYGIDLIILDHHTINKPYPFAHAIVNPVRKDSQFEFKNMATVGIAFYIVAGLKSKLEKDGYFAKEEVPDVKKYLDIVAMGTLADVAPLKGINRNLVKYGLKLLKLNKRVSIHALSIVSGVYPENINEKTIVYRLVPKLNAPGRMENGQLSYDLLMCEDYDESIEISKKLFKINRSRQEIQESIFKDALEQAYASLDYRWAIIVSGIWHPGVVGIVASKLAEHFKRPAIVISIQGEKGRGSARSFDNINIYDALEKSSSELISFGGHKGAAGVEVQRSKINDFAKLFNENIKPEKIQKDVVNIKIDSKAYFHDISDRFINELDMISPFGNGNIEPILYSEKVEVLSVKYPKDIHVSLILRDPNTRTIHKAIGFNMASKKSNLSKFINIVYVPERDFFMGSKKQLRILYFWSSLNG
jgi:single-stranded-DNA-specific exonuclease